MPVHTLLSLGLVSALHVLSERHLRPVHRRAQAQAVRKDRTTLQPNLNAHHAWQERLLIRMELLCALNVLSDRHHQLVHRRAHPVLLEPTPLQQDQLAHHA